MTVRVWVGIRVKVRVTVRVMVMVMVSARVRLRIRVRVMIWGRDRVWRSSTLRACSVVSQAPIRVRGRQANPLCTMP